MARFLLLLLCLALASGAETHGSLSRSARASDCYNCVDDVVPRATLVMECSTCPVNEDVNIIIRRPGEPSRLVYPLLRSGLQQPAPAPSPVLGPTPSLSSQATVPVVDCGVAGTRAQPGQECQPARAPPAATSAAPSSLPLSPASAPSAPVAPAIQNTTPQTQPQSTSPLVQPTTCTSSIGVLVPSTTHSDGASSAAAAPVAPCTSGCPQTQTSRAFPAPAAPQSSAQTSGASQCTSAAVQSQTAAAPAAPVVSASGGRGQPVAPQWTPPLRPLPRWLATYHYSCTNFPSLCPTYWRAFSSDCGSLRRQSPIDLPLWNENLYGPSTGNAPATTAAVQGTLEGDPLLKPLQLMYSPFRVRRVINNGHTPLVEIDEEDQDNMKALLVNQFGQTLYRLLHIHFHYPSEHTIGGKRFGLEMQLTHAKHNGPAETDEYLVVSVLFANSSRFEDNNSFLHKLFHNDRRPGGSNLPPPPEFANGTPQQPALQYATVDPPLLVDLIREPGLFLPDTNEPASVSTNDIGTLDRFYFYPGSFSMPPCSEKVSWAISAIQPRTTNQQIAMVRDVLPEGFNNRPTITNSPPLRVVRPVGGA